VGPEKKSAIMTPYEVAVALRVDPKTITRWAKSGRLTSFKTPGGHRRYSRAEVESFTTFRHENDGGPR
jgi:excisionase family DNA binding protein